MKRYDENPIWGDYFSNVETAYQISQRDRELRSLQKDVEATIQEVESLENVLESTEWSSNATKQHDKAVRTVDKSFKQYEEFVTDLSEKYDNAIEVIDELLPIVFTFLKKTAAIVISKDIVNGQTKTYKMIGISFQLFTGATWFTYIISRIIKTECCSR